MGLVTVQSILETKPIAARQSSGPETVPGTIRQAQADFFDERPPLYPWPKLLRSAGLNRVCKPREAMWKQAMETLELKPGRKVLDVGCGTGIWLDRLHRHFGVEGFGIDISSRSLRTAVSESSSGLSFLCGDAPQLPLADISFDVVITLDVLEHVVAQHHFLNEINRVLKPGGRLLLWTLNKSQQYTWNWWLEKIGVDIYDRVAHDPMLLPDMGEVRDLLDDSGMVVDRLVPFNSFFTLAMDEAIMLIVSAFSKLGLFNSVGWPSRYLGEGFLATTDAISRGLLRLLTWLDEPWTKRGLSNGFLIVAHRKAAYTPKPRLSENFEGDKRQHIPDRPIQQERVPTLRTAVAIQKVGLSHG